MNMHHFAIPLPRPLAPGQNVTIRFVQAGAPGVQHAHFHFAMQGQAASPVLRDSQGPEAQEGHSRHTVQKKEVEEMKRKEQEEEEEKRKAHLREQLTMMSPPSVTLDSVSCAVSAVWTSMAVDGRGSGAGDGRGSAVCYELMEEKEADGPVLLYSGPDAHYSFPVDGLFPGHTYQFYVVASGYGEKGVASPRSLLTIPARCPDKPHAPKVSLEWDQVSLEWDQVSLEWDQVSLEWDQVSLEWDQVRLEWDQVRLEWDQVSLEWDQVSLEWDQVSLEWDQVSLEWDQVSLEWDQVSLEWDQVSLEWDQCGKDFVEVFQGQQKQFKLNHKFPPATSCRFRLRVLNDVGWSDFSDNLVFKSGAGVPSPPPQPILTEASVGHLALKWAPPTDNGGSLIVSYCLEMDDPEMVIDGRVWRW
eukprot:Em0021g75a